MRNLKNLCLLVMCLLLTNFSFGHSSKFNLEKTEISPPTVAGEISILFAYTTKAATEVGGPKKIKQNAANGIRLLNEALANNGITYRAKMIPQFVHIKDNNTNTADVITEFNKSDGDYCAVHKYRKQLQADMVCLVFEGGNTSKAMLGGAVMVVTAKGAWDGSYIFPHEFGHAMGCKHETGFRVYDFGAKPYPYRTISANGGYSLPYFSQNKSVTHTTKDGVTKVIKIGDASHDNAAIIRQNAAAKSQLGENLPNLPNCRGRYPAELVNPDTEPNPPGTLTPFALQTFQWDKAGNVDFKYEASVDFAKTYPSYKLKYYDENGQPNNWLGSRSGFVNPGRPYDASFRTFRPDKITSGSKAELWMQFEDGGEYELVAFSIIDGETRILKNKPEENNPVGPGSKEITKTTPPDKFTQGENVCVDGKKEGNIHSKQERGFYYVAYTDKSGTESIHYSRISNGSCYNDNSGVSGASPNAVLKIGDKVCIRGRITGEITQLSGTDLFAVGYGYDNMWAIEWFKANEIQKGHCQREQTGSGYMGANGMIEKTGNNNVVTSPFKKGDKVCIDGSFGGNVTNVLRDQNVSVAYIVGSKASMDVFSPDRLTKGACPPGGNNGADPSQAPSVSWKGNTLYPGNRLNANEGLQNGSYTAIMEYNGNFVLSQFGNNKVWSTETFDKARNGYLIMQADGNLVLYDEGNVAYWSSQTHPYFNKRYANSEWKPVKAMLENGKIVLYNGYGKPVWNSAAGDLSGNATANNSGTPTNQLPSGYGSIKDNIECQGIRYCRDYNNTLFIWKNNQWQPLYGNIDTYACQFVPGQEMAGRLIITQEGTKFAYDGINGAVSTVGNDNNNVNGNNNRNSNSNNNGNDNNFNGNSNNNGNNNRNSGTVGNSNNPPRQLPGGYGLYKDTIECQGINYCRSDDNALFVWKDGRWQYLFNNVSTYSCRYTPGQERNGKLMITQSGKRYAYDGITDSKVPSN
ncbi:MAG: hypothetical protein AAF573_17540 [Bacteroidota bacterium]